MVRVSTMLSKWCCKSCLRHYRTIPSRFERVEKNRCRWPLKVSFGAFAKHKRSLVRSNWAKLRPTARPRRLVVTKCCSPTPRAKVKLEATSPTWHLNRNKELITATLASSEFTPYLFILVLFPRTATVGSKASAGGEYKVVILDARQFENAHKVVYVAPPQYKLARIICGVAPRARAGGFEER